MPGMRGSPSLLNGCSRTRLAARQSWNEYGDLTDDQAQANEPLKESEFPGKDGFLEENELLLEKNDNLKDEANEALERRENVDRQ